jgi:DNA-binding NarL/FixJ family response regulator/anti-sigma regulatory factor (Ser/Thr protein kinase)
MQQTALVIDANQQIREQLAEVLVPPDWTISEAPDNAAALELARSKKFDLVLTGKESSATDDIELLRAIRRVHPHTRVIILTGDSTPQEVLEAIREGAFSYFSTPFSLAALSEAVKDAVTAPSWDDGIEIISAEPRWVRLIARCELETAERVLRFIREMIDLPDEEKDTIGWALRELLMNAMEHGGNFNRDQYVELSYLRTKRAVACRIKDPGKGFSFEEIHHAAVANPPNDPIRHLDFRKAQNLRAGGFGILLSRNMVDELIYSEKGNEVVLIKYVDGPHST